MRPTFAGGPEDKLGMAIKNAEIVPPPVDDPPVDVPSGLGTIIQETVEGLVAPADDLVDTAAAEVLEMMPPSFAQGATPNPGMGVQDALALPPEPTEGPPVPTAGPDLVNTPGDDIAAGMTDGLNVDVWF